MKSGSQILSFTYLYFTSFTYLQFLSFTYLLICIY